MKIINLLLSNKNGGVEQSFVAYCLILKSLNHEVLAVVRKNAPYKKDVENLGIKVIEIENKFGYYDFFAIKNLRKIIKNFEANLVFAHVGKAVTLSKKALKKLPKIPLIAVNHSNNVKRSIGADIILSVNKEIFYKTIDGGVAENKSFVMPNFIEFDPELQKPLNLTNLSFDSKIRIGTMGRLAPEKGLEYLIRSIKILKDQNCPAELVIAGDGELKQELKNLTNSLNLNEEIKFLGWTNDKEKFFSSIDIFCLPSLEETFGIVLLEAMKYGKPIISTNCDGPKTIIKNEVNGILINQKSPEQIAAAILKLKNNPELVFDLVTNARENLLKNYSLKIAQEKFSSVIKIAFS
jgi:glycosyltransferase involved in cell wall biosynthesis